MQNALRVFALGLLMMIAAPAAAQMKQTLDQRSKLLGWEAVGKVEAQGSYCTGTLITRDIVLTAAHCVYDASGKRYRPDQIRFRSGYSHGAALSTQGVSHFVAHEKYQDRRDGYITAQSMPYDLALLKLSAPIFANGVNPFHIHQTPKTGQQVTLVSYGRGRSEALTREANCTLTKRYRDGIMSFDCDATFGSSGAPVFTREDGRMRILSVVSAVGSGKGGDYTLGMQLPQRVAELKAQLAKSAPGLQPNTGSRSVRVNRLSSQRGTSARFVRVPGS